MWERKKASEIRKVDFRFRFNPVYPLGFALFLAALFTFGRTQGYGGRYIQPLPSEPLSRSLQFFPLFFLVMFVVLYLVQLLSRVPQIPDHNAMICDRCHQVVGFTTDKHCPCGGSYELLTHWRWIEEDAPNFNPYV